MNNGNEEQNKIESPAAILTNAIQGGLFRKLQRHELKKIIHTPQEGIRGRFQAAALQVIWKLRFQRRIKQVMKSKVEVFKSYFTLNMQKIFLYELQRPRRVKVYEYQWDFVLVFPNPDTKDDTDPMSKLEALEHFDSCIRADSAESQIQQRVMKRSERKAFQKVFKQLPDLAQQKDDQNTDEEPKKARYRGGRFYADDNGHWHDRFQHPTDVQTLMMNVIQRKLGVALGLHTEAMISNDGNNIFLLIKADEEDLQIHAEKIQQNVQIELGWCDLWSLQPCDKNFYPYHAMIKPDRQIQDLEEDLKEYFKEVKAEGEDDDDEDDDQKVAGDHVTAFQWSIYKEYLQEVKMRYDILNKAGIGQRDHIRGLFLKKLTKSALDHANDYAIKNNPNKRTIKNCCTSNKPPQLLQLWNRLGETKSIGPYSDYLRVFNDQGQDKYLHLWRRHIIDETGKRSIFKEVDRLKILDAMIQSKLVIRKLLAHGYISGYFPLHNTWFRNGKMRFEPGTEDWPPYNKDSEKEAAYDEDDHVSKKKGLEYRWKCRCTDPFYNPASKIRNYFGEKIAFYFTYISLYSKFLLWTGFFGVLVFVLQYIGDKQDSDTFRITVIVFNALYIFVAVLWSTVFFEMWKRKENKLSIQWGQTDFEEDQVIRPTFVGVRRRSPVDDDMNDVWFSPAKRRCRQAIGYLISILILIVVIGIVGAILYLRKYLTDTTDKQSLLYKGIPSITATINAIQIVIFNMLYNKIALWLTKWENQRTQSDFESSLISKTFMFQFVNSFNSLFYMAYLKRWFEGCVEKGERSHDSYCDGQLRNQLTIIFIVSILKNFMEIGLPYAMNWLRERKLRRLREEVNQMTPEQKLRFNVENQFALSNYQSMEVDGTYSDYIEMMVQYGYVILFSIGFPMAPVLAMLNNIFEVQVDKYKLMKLTKRPVPLSANGIGIWAMIIDIVTTISIFTNMGVFCFTMSTFQGVEDQDVRFYTFIALILFFMALRYIIAYAIPDISQNMALVMRRHQYLVEKSLKGFIKAKPRSILPEKSNFTVEFTIKDNKEQDEFQKVGNILAGKKGSGNSGGGGLFGALGGVGGPINQNASLASERSGLLGIGMTSQASLPAVGDERNLGGNQTAAGFPPPPVRGSGGQGGNYFGGN